MNEDLRYCPLCDELYQFTKMFGEVRYVGHVCTELTNGFGELMVVWWRASEQPLIVTKLCDPPPPLHLPF